jgi:CheY-like chemotaxis protein
VSSLLEEVIRDLTDQRIRIEESPVERTCPSVKSALKILQRLFSSEGYEVDAVPDSVAGLEILRQAERLIA